MDRRAYLRSAGALAIAGLGGCLGTLSPDRPDYDVGMSTTAFRPERHSVSVGETVRWLNTSSHAHTVTAYEDGIPGDAAYFASGGFDSESAARSGWNTGTDGALYEGDSFEHTFEVPGTYNYFCVPHERSAMVGAIVVADGESTTVE